MVAVGMSLIISWIIVLAATAIFFWLIFVIIRFVTNRIYKDKPHP